MRSSSLAALTQVKGDTTSSARALDRSALHHLGRSGGMIPGSLQKKCESLCSPLLPVDHSSRIDVFHNGF